MDDSQVIEDLELEFGVPVPLNNVRSPRSSLRQYMEGMEPGSSVVLPAGLISKAKAVQFNTSAYGLKFAIRTIDEHQFRVWRTK